MSATTHVAVMARKGFTSVDNENIIKLNHTASCSLRQSAPGPYLPKAPPLPATLLGDSGLLRKAVELLQVTDRKIPLNGECLSQYQSLKVSDVHHLRKEKGP